MILLRAIAAYEQCDNAQAVLYGLSEYAHRIGAGPLARAVADEEERRRSGVLAAVPDFSRIGESRFEPTAEREGGG